MSAPALPGLRRYVTIAAVGAVLFGAWLVLGRARSYVIQIDWAWTGDLATGAEVLVDGVVVGTLATARRDTRRAQAREEVGTDRMAYGPLYTCAKWTIIHSADVEKAGCP